MGLWLSRGHPYGDWPRARAQAQDIAAQRTRDCSAWVANRLEARVKQAVLGALLPYRTSSSGYRLENRFRYVIAIC